MFALKTYFKDRCKWQTESQQIKKVFEQISHFFQLKALI